MKHAERFISAFLRTFPKENKNFALDYVSQNLLSIYFNLNEHRKALSLLDSHYSKKLPAWENYAYNLSWSFHTQPPNAHAGHAKCFVRAFYKNFPNEKNIPAISDLSRTLLNRYYERKEHKKGISFLSSYCPKNLALWETMANRLCGLCYDEQQNRSLDLTAIEGFIDSFHKLFPLKTNTPVISNLSQALSSAYSLRMDVREKGNKPDKTNKAKKRVKIKKKERIEKSNKLK